MREYSKTRLLKNIAYMMKLRGLKTGELESAARVSTGYFSRLKNNEKDDAAPGIDTLSLISLKLGVTLDTLLYCDFTELNDTELFIRDFLHQILSQTSNGKLLWDKEAEQFVRNCRHYEETRKPHPLMKGALDEKGKEIIRYNSLFTDDECWLDGDVFKLKRASQVLYVARIKHQKVNGGCDVEFELYLWRDKNLKKICNAAFETKDVLFVLVQELYEAAEASSRILKIDDEVKKGLEEFLSDKDVKTPSQGRDGNIGQRF